MQQQSPATLRDGAEVRERARPPTRVFSQIGTCLHPCHRARLGCRRTEWHQGRLSVCLPGLQHGGLPPRGSRPTAAGLHSLAAHPPARAAPPCRPHPQARKDEPLGGPNHPGGRDQLTAAPGPSPSCCLVASGPEEEVKEGKGEKRSLRQRREGRPDPNCPQHHCPSPSPRGPEPLGAGRCTDVVSATRRRCFLGGATCSSGPQDTFVPCPAPRTSQHTLTIAAALPGGGWPLHAALTRPPREGGSGRAPRGHRPGRSFCRS